MATDRLLDLFSLMALYEGRGDSNAVLCKVAAEFVALDGANIVLTSDGGEFVSLCASSAAARALADLEIVAGEGPSDDASRGEPVWEPDLLDELAVRWSTYSPLAIAIGARAVFGYPIRLGAVRIGVLSLFRLSPGPLAGTQEGDAYLMASVVGRSVLAREAGGPDRGLVGELNGTTALDFTVHQAAGMVAVQGAMSVRDALVSLRALAFSTDCELSALAGRVVARETYFDPLLGTWREAFGKSTG